MPKNKEYKISENLVCPECGIIYLHEKEFSTKKDMNDYIKKWDVGNENREPSRLCEKCYNTASFHNVSFSGVCSICGSEYTFNKNFKSEEQAEGFRHWFDNLPNPICLNCRKAGHGSEAKPKAKVKTKEDLINEIANNFMNKLKFCKNKNKEFSFKSENNIDLDESTTLKTLKELGYEKQIESGEITDEDIKIVRDSWKRYAKNQNRYAIGCGLVLGIILIFIAYFIF
jgi:rubredoxin